MALGATGGDASSHREAPFVTENPKVDATDFYMFRSYEPGRENYVTLIANYLPLQDPYGGPNYFTLDPSARYRINIENDGDPEPDIVFQFRFSNTLRNIAVQVGSEQVPVALRNIGQIDSDPASDAVNNVAESYTVKIIRRSSTGSVHDFLTNGATGERTFTKPVDNIGRKSVPGYAGYAAGFVHAAGIPGCADGRVFAGQRKDPFAVNLGEVFDLVNIANPVGGDARESDDLDDKNVTSLVLEVPIDCLTADGDVIGGWTTALLPKTTTLRNNPTYDRPAGESAKLIQVSRLGMPLVNEVVIGLKDKNRFNASRPRGDLQFATYVTNPTLPELLEILHGTAAPNNFPRQDLLATFITGFAGINAIGFGEMQRLNTAVEPTRRGGQSRLGVLGADLAGFPNGRRPGDDVVDITLRVAMGVLCHAFPGTFCDPADAPTGNLRFTDGAIQRPSQFGTAFPYLRTPIPGSPSDARPGRAVRGNGEGP
ncbi:MAG: DUF4331 domain-containing protein [Thermoanaerobaculia bacterium]